MFRRWLRWRLRRQARIAVRMLARMDRSMSAAGFTRTERKQFWRDFTKHAAGRQRCIDFLVEASR